ncbi:hypothetical protein [Burkholderia pseudomallei]|uniref:hypothetical protein n=1 Tax=Burkholderia pseudomallei TaxID=28450 RepID=UPI000F1681EC|nr:hypothetical protein [Burkholderia pseudomallei]CAJ3067442.1 Uncharacterised protein [Burkholderia pseudomallei]VCK73170.1 Uncharacterised protein [Burkholderia pseudomallei]VCK79799.1 Uncharacterised protein [Burkholderia pseudomallei]VCK80227.1 Uncharacterised protein [Burkholderia pseudomallei]VCK81018.1 Uncharacterised protein [Burkholderia pseudomallei]
MNAAPYSPRFNRSTGLPQPILTPADFAAFVRWLIEATPAGQAEREKNYARVRKSIGATQDAEATFIGAVAGGFLRGEIEAGVQSADQALLNDPTARQWLRAAHGHLSRFFAAVSENVFEAQLTALDVNLATVRALGAVYRADRDLQCAAVSALAAGSNAAPTAPAEALVAWLERPQTRSALQGAGCEAEAELGRFSPFVAFSRSLLGPAFRAEWLGWLLAYARSGLLEQDLRGDVKPDGADEAEALAEWRRCLDAIAHDPECERSSLDPVVERLSQRLVFVAHTLDVNGTGPDATATLGRMADTHASLFEAFDEQEPTGLVLHSPELGHTLVLCAADDALKSLDGKVSSSLRGLQRALGLSEASVAEVATSIRRLAILAPAVLDPVADTSGAGADGKAERPGKGEAFFNLLVNAAPAAPVRAELADALNAAGPLSKVIKPGLRIEWLSQVSIQLVGQKDERWAAARDALTRVDAPGLAEDALRQLVALADQGWRAIERAGFKADLVLGHAVAEETLVSDAAAQPLVHLLDLSLGCAQHFVWLGADHRLTAETLASVRDSLATWVDQIAALHRSLKANTHKRSDRDHQGAINRSILETLDSLRDAIEA